MLQHNVPVTYREPFAFGREPWFDARPYGETILEIVRSVPNLPIEFIDRGGVACINGEIVPRELWQYVRPKPTSEVIPVSVTLHWPLQSPGGASGTKSIIGLVSAIALLAVTFALTGPFGAGLVAGIGLPATLLGGAISTASLLAGAVGIAGALAISALTAPPTSQPAAAQLADNVNQDNRDPASASGNVIAPGGSIPRVIGTRKIFPPLICEPVIELINNEDEQIEVVYALNGPHTIDDIKIDGVDITDAPSGINYETRDGITVTSDMPIVQRQGRTTALNVTMNQHKLESDDLSLLNNDTPESFPIWHRLTTFDSPDSAWIHLLFPGGMSTGGAATLAMPFRMRMREVGSSPWINFPEFHFANNSTRPLKRQIQIIWDSTPGGIPALNSTPNLKDFYYARANPPPQTVAPTSITTGTVWNCDTYFLLGGASPGNDYFYFGNESSTNITNMELTSNGPIFYVGDGFPLGRYEIEIIRGYSYAVSSFNLDTYGYVGSVGTIIYDFFTAVDNSGTFITGQDQTNFVSTAGLVRIVSIWNENPITQDAHGKFAFLAITAVNRQINRVSCLASGIVNQWDGANWGFTGTGSSNPAAHYRDVLLGAQNHDPLDFSQIDDQDFGDWSDYCDAHTWTVDAIIDDMRTQDVLSLIASCGYARPYQSDIYGVTIDKDRSLEDPIQVFSRINTANMKYEKAFARVPSGLIITYHSINKDYENDQEIVYQTDPSVGVTGLLESITYDGIVDIGQVQARGKFDLDQANLRSTFYSFDADIESLVCRRGSLVALQHDILTSRAADAHVKTVLTSGGNITGFVLDGEIPVVSGSTGIAIRDSAGAITTHAISDATGNTDTITFTTPFAIDGNIVGYNDTGDKYGCLVVSGVLGTEYRRMFVFSITPTKDLRATVILVDEAPDLVRFGGG